jgi:hypothetical protein
VDLDEKALVYSSLESWLGIEINEGGLFYRQQKQEAGKWDEYFPQPNLLNRFLSR